ncbi:hypothetical protein CAPTEDRAFT_215898 [Capitella teleta]|uniref:Uncharacterized protein n=1 Tax=Capitella teleta TaxID=283909 RepID=R7U7R5_CAPTE|nr:hypothetical protein CAPTEDRAFT_215898 [Capitella teleta]|eukprot:ELT99175.1 hypothetical protein CAPTEDRAFT_215898 [Capitella teleta]
MQISYLLGFTFLNFACIVFGHTCHSCTGGGESDCANLLENTPELSGTCSVEEGEGKCFIRREPNGATYWGCLTDTFWPGVPWRSFNGCMEDWINGWSMEEDGKSVEKPIVWCLCDWDLCNLKIEDMLKETDQGEGSQIESGSD